LPATDYTIRKFSHPAAPLLTHIVLVHLLLLQQNTRGWNIQNDIYLAHSSGGKEFNIRRLHPSTSSERLMVGDFMPGVHARGKGNIVRQENRLKAGFDLFMTTGKEKINPFQEWILQWPHYPSTGLTS
jgi:hypothetical protein